MTNRNTGTHFLHLVNEKLITHFFVFDKLLFGSFLYHAIREGLVSCLVFCNSQINILFDKNSPSF